MEANATEVDFTREFDLGAGLAIYKTKLSALREQEKNARYMDKEEFDRLTANIAKRGGLESLPLCTIETNPAGNQQLMIISGHHRIKAARAAGMTEMFVIVDEKPLTHDEVVSKQLSHNALVGKDDMQLLRELYASIEDLDARIASGIKDFEGTLEMPPVKIDEITFDIAYEIINILFMPNSFERFEELLTKLDRDARIYVADKADFERFATASRETASRYNIRNMSAIMVKMLDIIDEYYFNQDQAIKGVPDENSTAQ